MCEFKVFLEGEQVFEDAVYVEVTDGKVILRNILGEEKEMADCHIIRVNVPSERLVLSSKRLENV